MIAMAVAVGLAVAAFAALLIGPAAFTVLVIALALVVLVDLGLLLTAAGARPVLPVAFVPGLVLPAMVATDVAGDAGAGWDRLPGVFAVAFLLGFVLVLVFGRRGGAVMGLAATAMLSLLVGLGASGAILLRGLPNGFAWTFALLVLVVAADVAAPSVRLVRRRIASDEDAYLRDEGADDPLLGVVPAVVAVALAATGLGLFFGAPLRPLVLVLLGLVAVVAALGGSYLRRALSAESGVDIASPEPRIGDGLVLGALDAMIIAAPAAYVLARSVSL